MILTVVAHPSSLGKPIDLVFKFRHCCSLEQAKTVITLLQLFIVFSDSCKRYTFMFANPSL
jgi:hypothetical protein